MTWADLLALEQPDIIHGVKERREKKDKKNKSDFDIMLLVCDVPEETR